MSEQTSADINPISSEAKSPTPKKAKKQRQGGFLGWFNLLLIIVLAAVIAVGGWFGWRHHNVLVAQLSYFAQTHQQHTAGEQALQQQNARLQSLVTDLAKETAVLREQNSYAIDQLNKMAGADRQDWLVAEAEYLLRLANQRLELERDWGSALAMLQAADKVLVEANNPRLTVVRSHIADEMLALRKAPAIDRQGAVLRLQSLQKAIPALPWLPEKMLSEENGQPVTKVKKTTWYGEFWDNFTSSLYSLVRIRERSEANDAPLTPSQQFYLQQNMYLMLEQAQLALLREDQGLYEHSLERVHAWLQSYIMLADDNTRVFSESIKELQQWQVAPARPDISGSLVSLQKLIEQSRRGAVVGGAE